MDWAVSRLQKMIHHPAGGWVKENPSGIKRGNLAGCWMAFCRVYLASISGLLRYVTTAALQPIDWRQMHFGNGSAWSLMPSGRIADSNKKRRAKKKEKVGRQSIRLLGLSNLTENEPNCSVTRFCCYYPPDVVTAGLKGPITHSHHGPTRKKKKLEFAATLKDGTLQIKLPT